ncbi:MAG: hypothetical protein PHI99_06070 [Syntrophales bacterium]|nr:hypothetical protein [Syntrophales bacterium]
MKGEIINLWNSVNRPGVDKVIEFLNESDFFTAPCSTEFHLSRPGGLAEHSRNVFVLLDEKVKRYGLEDQISRDTRVICGLGHDLCKANFYVIGTKNAKENGVWKEKRIYKVEDQFPMGHGEKSVSILQDCIHLTEQEKLAIRWHMVAFDPGIHFFYPSGSAFRTAVNKHPLVTLLFTADYEASQILEASE